MDERRTALHQLIECQASFRGQTEDCLGIQQLEDWACGLLIARTCHGRRCAPAIESDPNRSEPADAVADLPGAVSGGLHPRSALRPKLWPVCGGGVDRCAGRHAGPRSEEHTSEL